MFTLNRVVFSIFIVSIFLTACTTGEDQHTMFQQLGSDRTNITFSNTITSTDSINVQTDSFLYNGAGVAVGDINNDGLPDIFFSGNMVSSRLYLNQGNMRFLDITETAGLETSKRVTGASFVDINSNGYLDIYLSVSGYPWSTPDERENLLFINNGDSTFTEAASDYQINDPGFTTHAVFLDYNKNGYLDLFLLGNSPEEFGRGDSGGGFIGAKDPIEFGTDKLYKNNGDGTFTNVSDEAGILNRLGYGLGVVVSDLNNDGWPDMYISNDITPNDVLYINNGDGTFDDKAADYLMHTSFAGMGIDIADFSNNGWPDIIQTDMMPEVLADRKRMSGSTSYSTHQQLRQQGYYPHYNTNTLQLNRGVSNDGDIIFSEIGRMAGVAYTDWSWAALFADFDNDGHKDLFISNGYPKAVNDFDYLSDMFRARRSGDEEQVQQEEQKILDNLHSYRVSNYLFQNNADLTFTDKTRNWGLHQPNFSYGAAYADLNNNGRLDLVINNINDTAQIFENRGSDEQPSNFLQISLESETPNRRGLGAKLTLSQNGEKQYIHHTPYRGYMSTIDDRIHFGLGNNSGVIDSLEITWPDGSYQLKTDVEPNQHLTLYHSDADQTERITSTYENQETLFTPVLAEDDSELRHQETEYADFSIQAMLPYQISKQNIPVAVGDINGNGLDDIFIGGAADVSGKLFIQQDNGRFVKSNQEQPWDNHIRFEDWGAHFFDANGNGLQDLYVSSGSFRLSGISELLQDRLYINQGNGQFMYDPDALPEIRTSTSTIESGDFTGNGQPDLFIGGRVAPRSYPNPVRSYLLQNDGARFTDITADAAPDLITPGGLITDAVWVDYDGDEKPDLVTVGEWMPIQFYQNEGEKLNNVTESMDLPPMRGWWWSVEKGDLNNDGYPDLVAGNQGLNFSFRTSEESKFGLYASDFSDGWDTDLIFVQEIDGIEYPYFGLAKMGNTINRMNHNQYNSFEAFSSEPIHNIFTSEDLGEAIHYQTDTFASVKLLNNGTGTFSVGELPNEAQIAPIKSMIIHDFDRDELNDLLIAGNMFQTEPNIPRADAGKGLLLNGDGEGNLEPVPIHQSGFYAPKDVKFIRLIDTAEGKAVLIANHNEELQLFRLTSP